VHKVQTDVVQSVSESARLGAFCAADEAYPADSARYMDIIEAYNGAVAAVLSYCVRTRSEGERCGELHDLDTGVKERQAR
jgi:hypothetical protein